MNVFEAVREYGITARQAAEHCGIKINRNGMAVCPFHNDKNPSMKIDRRYYCFGCGEKGDAIDFVAKFYGLGKKDAAVQIEDDLTPYFKKFSELTTVKDKRKKQVYVLTNYGSTHEQDLYRIYTLRDMGYSPYVMVYEKPTAPEETRRMQRWVNNRWLFHSVKDFKDYDPNSYKKRKEGNE